MTYVGLFACYAGMLASVVIPNCSLALSLCSTTEVSQDSRLGSTLFVSVQQTPPTADDKTDECLTIINDMRTQTAKGLLEALTKAQDGEVTESLKSIKKEEVQGATAKTIAAKLGGTDAATCEFAASANAQTVWLQYPGLVIPFAYGTKLDCISLIQTTYRDGRDYLENRFRSAGPTLTHQQAKYNFTEAPFNNVAASNVAFLMSSKSKKVSCAATENCTGGHNILFCYFIDPLQTGDAPFITEVYNALWGVGKGAVSISVPSVSTALLSLALIILS
ncbi:SAG family member [Eimeria tenella]|uniref:SAG family member n=1 Tax=Eimeria tenella TaxID=5802 RepID=U6KNZ2_EIMTE|nr:SAG family member [Eimeria tenella]CDJ37173.1 SAG family member [Eimeria tenella]|eukprot:XP_013228011.1 SAG family member [Eimeria tenella]